MTLPFTVGHHYRDRRGTYEVLRIDGDQLTIRYADGRTLETSVDLQARIWRNMQDEEEFGAEDVDIDLREGGSSGSTSGRGWAEVHDLVAPALRTVDQPWPPDVTDRVCLAIEQRPDWLKDYQLLVAAHGELTVNSAIGAHVKDITGLENTGRMGVPHSTLIKSYSILAPAK